MTSALPTQTRPCGWLPEQEPGWTYLAQLQVRERAGIDEGLGNH